MAGRTATLLSLLALPAADATAAALRQLTPAEPPAMHPARRHLESIRRLLTRHADTGQIPAAEVRVLLAELEAVLEADPAPELVRMAELTDIDRNAYGYPTELPPR